MIIELNLPLNEITPIPVGDCYLASVVSALTRSNACTIKDDKWQQVRRMEPNVYTRCWQNVPTKPVEDFLAFTPRWSDTFQI